LVARRRIRYGRVHARYQRWAGAARRAAQGSVDVDRQFPGIRFRLVDGQGNIRRHMRVFVNEEATRDLRDAVAPTDALTIMQALSGGSQENRASA